MKQNCGNNFPAICLYETYGHRINWWPHIYSDVLVHILSVCGVPRPGKGKAIDHVRVAADRLLRLARPVHVIPLLSPQTPHSGAKCCRDQKIFARPLNRTCAGAHSGCLPHRSGTGEERPLIRHGFTVPPPPRGGKALGAVRTFPLL